MNGSLQAELGSENRPLFFSFHLVLSSFHIHLSVQATIILYAEPYTFVVEDPAATFGKKLINIVQRGGICLSLSTGNICHSLMSSQLETLGS